MVLLDNSAIYGSIAEVYDHKFIHDGYNIFTPSIETLELNGYKNSFVRINRKDKKYGKSILSQKVNDSKLYIINSNTYKFIIKNNDKNLEAKVKQESEKHDNEKVTYYIVPQNVVDFLKIPNEMILDSDKLTYTPTIKASGIKANINKKYKLLSSNRKPNTRDYKVNIVDNDSGKGFFEKRMGKTIYYICLNTTEAGKLVDGTECNVLNIYSFLSDIAFTYLKGIGLGSIIIVDSKRDAQDGWVDLIQYCKENIYKSFNVSFGEKVKLFAGNAHFGYMSDTENNLKLLKGVIGEDHKFFSFFGQESNFDSNAISLDRLKESFKMLGIEFESVSSYALFEEYILQNYPMIDLLGSYEIPNHINNIGNYIKGMDLLKNN
jgi:hypothetical protein